MVDNTTSKLFRTLARVFSFYELNPHVVSEDLDNWKDIPFSIKHGVYIIKHNDDILYIGQGRVKRRQKHHIDNITGENLITETSSKNGRTKSTKAWEYIRESYKPEVKNCKVYYMDCITKYDAIAVEGALIKFLMPLANEETFNK
jgi:hypothetical protein